MIFALVEVEPDLFELPPPPARLHLRFLEGASEWTVIVWSRTVKADLVRSWGRKAGFTPSPGTGQGRVVMFTCERLPGVCSLLVEVPGFTTLIRDLEDIEIPLHTDRSNVQEIVDLLEDLDAQPVLRHIRSTSSGAETEAETEVETGTGAPTASPDLLTERQREALQHAFHEGYYSVPRDSTLKEVAADLGMSAGGLSELLRRAESQLVASYLTGSGFTEDPSTPTGIGAEER